MASYRFLLTYQRLAQSVAAEQVANPTYTGVQDLALAVDTLSDYAASLGAGPAEQIGNRACQAAAVLRLLAGLPKNHEAREDALWAVHTLLLR